MHIYIYTQLLVLCARNDHRWEISELRFGAGASPPPVDGKPAAKTETDPKDPSLQSKEFQGFKGFKGLRVFRLQGFKGLGLDVKRF